MHTSNHSTIIWEVRDHVGWLTLNRPEKYNAFDLAMCDEIAEVWATARRDDDVRVVVVTAAGDKAFCTGIDRDFVPADDGVDYDFTPYTYDDPGRQLGPRANRCWKPVIAAVNGMACGGAFYLLGEADFIIAADHATFFDPHLTYGMPAVYEPMAMMRRMPFGEVMRMTLLANHERMSATRAHQIGLVSEVVPADELLERATWAADAIASQPPGATVATVRSLWAAREMAPGTAEELGAVLLGLGMTKESMDQGSEVFSSGQRIEPRVR
ncbi:MAG TPA: enoyl-CoA hydratase/isomerase family protein [Acidimicrobiales bacterium]|nr:enoyl-CoA hydratase/isomerase family protein [Acidimicrobiales bacterium]